MAVIEDYQIYRETAEEAALKAGAALRQMWGSALQIKSKGYRDLVTNADFEAQEIITSTILSRFPNHGFITEEEAPELSSSGKVLWIIDPLDGTSNYSRQHPERYALFHSLSSLNSPSLPHINHSPSTINHQPFPPGSCRDNTSTSGAPGASVRVCRTAPLTVSTFSHPGRTGSSPGTRRYRATLPSAGMP